MNPPVILVDVSNAVFRCHWAHKSLETDGVLTGATYGFLRIVHDLRKSVSPRIVFAWDHGVPVPGARKPANWRDDVLKTYKATRSSGDTDTRPEVFRQMGDIFGLLGLLGYSSVSVLGLEADDIIGLLARNLKSEVLIFSTDQDFYQLLDSRVRILVPKKDKGGFKTITKTDVESEYGIPVSRWAEYLALGGDKSDNIKPMRGMGPKTALHLIQSGVDLSKKLQDQPRDFLTKYGPVWCAIQASYYAARIPTSWSDERITTCINKAGGAPKFSVKQTWENKSLAEEKFTQFLADRDMVSLLSVRRSFFELGASQCNNPPQESPPHPKVRKALI